MGAGASPSSTNTNTVRPGVPSQIPGGTPGELVPGAGPNFSGGRSDAFILPGGELPMPLDPNSGRPLSPEESRTLEARLLPDARSINDPSQRSLALERVARQKVLKHVAGDNKLEEAHDALREALQAAMMVRESIIRDLRYLAIVRTALTLGDEFTRLGTYDETYILEKESMPLIPLDVDDGAVSPTRQPSGDVALPRMTVRDRVGLLVRAEQERAFASETAQRLESSNFLAEMLYRVVENESQASQKVANEVLRVVDPKDFPPILDKDGKELTDTRGNRITSRSGRYDLVGAEDALKRMADRGIVFAANDAAKIPKPVWRDRSMVTIAVEAASSEQFARGLEVSRRIPHPEYRSDALIRLAESQARRNLNADATATYTEAAQAVASIRIADPRDILNSVLIDSLISVGRFDDARACIPLYSTQERQIAALGTIAESQGQRRLDQAAFAWINTERPPSSATPSAAACPTAWSEPWTGIARTRMN